MSSHPVQYNAPLFALLAKQTSFELMVFYTWGKEAIGPKYDPDFMRVVNWDIPLLNDYQYTFCENKAKKPGSNHFFGIINPNLIQQITDWGADIIWVWGWGFYSHLQILRHFKGKLPIWFRGDSTLLDESKGFSLKKMARRIFLTWIYRHVDKVFYVGTHNKSYFTIHGVKSFQLVYAPHAVDNQRFAFNIEGQEAKIEKLRLQCNINQKDTVFLYAGKLEPKKNPFFILQLANYMKGDQFKFIIVGNGVLEDQLKIAASVDGRISFLDFQNQSTMPTLYRLASFFILPSVGPGETWGLALNEALASGIPIIASDKCGGAVDLINPSNGYLLNFERLNFKDLGSWIVNFNHFEMRNQSTFFKERFNYNELIKQVNSNIK